MQLTLKVSQMSVDQFCEGCSTPFYILYVYIYNTYNPADLSINLSASIEPWCIQVTQANFIAQMFWRLILSN